MTDHTSEDLLKQPEPDAVDEPPAPVSEQFKDDPVIDTDATKTLADYFSKQKSKLGVLPNDQGAPAPARPSGEAQTIRNFVGDAPQSINPLEEELKAVKRELALLKLAPSERYSEVLDDAEISMEEAHQILDTVLVQLKPWKERTHVVRGLYVEFQTRGQHDQRRLDQWAEKTRPQLDTTVVAEALINNMAGSLLSYGDRVFEGETEEERYKDAYDFLANMPYPAFRLLQKKLSEFDAKINAVFSEGYLENF